MSSLRSAVRLLLAVLATSLYPRGAFGLGRLAMQQRGIASSGSARHGHGGAHRAEECGKWTESDLTRPIKDVLAEHPGVNGFCYFAGVEMWINPMAANPDYVQSGKSGALYMRTGDTCAVSYPTGEGPLKTAHYDAGTVTSHIDCNYYIFDDLYFYALGWLKNQRLDGSLMSNATAWEALAREECDSMQKKYDIKDEELTMASHGQSHGSTAHNMVIFAESAVAFNNGTCQMATMPSPPKSVCEPVTSREFAVHAYAKCLLGGDAGDADEMAYAQARACLLPGNVIGHESECE